jgi:hypothetical protein
MSEFTANWLQALMLATDSLAARNIRPWMTDIALLGAAKSVDGQIEASERLWKYGSSHGLLPLLGELPLRQPRFRFEGDECFQFAASGSDSVITTASEWAGWLGLVPLEQSWRGTITQSDWTNLLRREAVRLNKGLNVQAIPPTSMVEVGCTARWDTDHWIIQFHQPDWLVLEMEDVVCAPRPSAESIESMVLDVLDFAGRQWNIASKLSAFPPLDAPWMNSVALLYSWHRAILVTNEVGLSPWMRRVWSAVWPVVYRERNRLKGTCDLDSIRKEIAECFRAAPQLTEWMFVFARLFCEVRFERGLGIAADFVDGDA